MKSTMLLLAVACLVLSHANKLSTREAKAKTAFCMTGNVRANHAEDPSKELRKRLDMIDPEGIVFAYVNPCEAQTKPWWWEMVHKGQKTFVPKKPQDDCWGGSFWREHIKPTVLKEYRDADVAPQPRSCQKDAPTWVPGVHQQWKGVKECYKLIEEYEEKHSFKFETVARFRADACHDAEGCNQVSYCGVEKLDRQKVYLHDHSAGEEKNYFDNFAILSRQYAGIYFNALDIYFSDCTVGGAGESLLNAQMRKHSVPTEDRCDCHPSAHNYCPPKGGSVFIERTFQADLETYSDMSIFVETQPAMHFLKIPSENATSSEIVKPAYMRLQLSLS